MQAQLINNKYGKTYFKKCGNSIIIKIKFVYLYDKIVPPYDKKYWTKVLTKHLNDKLAGFDFRCFFLYNNMKKIGIYKITSPTKKVYIGQSVDIDSRFKSYMKLRCKTQQKLFASLNKYGVDKHTFKIIHICNKNELNSLEKYYVDLFQTFNNKNGLNLKDGGGARGACSEETKMKLSVITKNMSIEQRLKLSILNKGKKLSKETIEKVRQVHLGRKNTDETKLKMSLSAKGRKFTIEHKLKLSEAKNKIILNTETGIFYIGAKDAHEAISKLNINTFRSMLNGNCKNKTNFIIV